MSKNLTTFNTHTCLLVCVLRWNKRRCGRPVFSYKLRYIVGFGLVDWSRPIRSLRYIVREYVPAVAYLHVCHYYVHQWVMAHFFLDRKLPFKQDPPPATQPLSGGFISSYPIKQLVFILFWKTIHILQWNTSFCGDFLMTIQVVVRQCRNGCINKTSQNIVQCHEFNRAKYQALYIDIY